MVPSVGRLMTVGITIEAQLLTANTPYYEVVREVLATNIASGRLPAGTRLFTSAVADRLGVSRPPVKRALTLLEKQGLVHLTGANGYVVGATDGEAQSVRRNLHMLDLELSGRLSGTHVQASWERIFEAVENDVMNCIPFGTYQISEAALGDHFSVSRTVIRDVLSRMHGRNIIAKDRSSHWIAGPFSARMLDEAHDVRRLLEPSALGAAMPHLERGALSAMRERVRARPGARCRRFPGQDRCAGDGSPHRLCRPGAKQEARRSRAAVAALAGDQPAVRHLHRRS